MKLFLFGLTVITVANGDVSHLFRNAGGGSDGYNYPRPAQQLDDFTNNNFIQQIPSQQQPQIIPIQTQLGFIQQQHTFQDKPFVTPIQNNYVQQQKPDYLPPCSNGGIGPNCQISQVPARPNVPIVRDEYRQPQPQPQCQFGGIWPNCYNPPQPQTPKYIPPAPAAPRPCTNGGIGPNCQIPQPPPRPYVPPVRDEYRPPQAQPQCQFGGVWPNCYNPQPSQTPKYIPPAPPASRPCTNGGIGPSCQIPQPPPRPYVPPVRDEYRPPQPQPQCQFGGVWPNCYNPPPQLPQRQQDIHNDYLPPCRNGGYGPNCQIPQQIQPQPSHSYDDESGYKYNIPRVQLN